MPQLVDYKNGVRLMHFDILSKEHGIKHFSTTRSGGVSQGVFAGLNMGYMSGDDVATVQKNRHILADALDVSLQQFVFGCQTHKNNVAVVSANDAGRGANEHVSGFADTDALITNVPRIFISVLTADCTPILLYDTQNRAVAAIHAGWKGTVGKIVLSTIAAMQQHYGTNPRYLSAAIGTAIRWQNYAVGNDVVEAAMQAFGDVADIVRTDEKKVYFDQITANYRLLLAAGVLPHNIEISPYCTFENPDLFYSARYGKNTTGRQASGIMLE